MDNENNKENSNIETLVESLVENTQPQQVEVTSKETQPIKPEPKKEEPKKINIKLILIIIGILLIGIGLFLYFGTNTFKENGNEEEEEVDKNLTSEDYSGIYTTSNDKLYIYNISDTEFHYTISGVFTGIGEVEEGLGKGRKLINDEYFEFKKTKDGIELIYHASDENTSISVDTGKYTRVGDYTKENVYKEAVGDPSFLESNYSGLFKNGEIELYIYQKNDREIMVETYTSIVAFISEKFEIQGDNRFVSKSFFNEDEIAYELIFDGNQANLIVHDDVMGIDEDAKKLELTYTLDRKVTQDEIIDIFYNSY